MQTDAKLLPSTPSILRCGMLRPFAHVLLRVVGGCCTKCETGQTFEPKAPNISFVPWSPKRSETTVDPFAQLVQHCWGHAHELHMVYKVLWVVSFPRCTAGPNIVGSCRIRLHTTANTDAVDFPTAISGFSCKLYLSKSDWRDGRSVCLPFTCAN